MVTDIVPAFQQLYYDSGAFLVRWLGVTVGKCPLDLWQYQEIITQVRPDVIVEAGTAHGGSALFFASICELIGNGRVISIDIGPDQGRPEHPRVTYVAGSSVSQEVAERVRALIGPRESVMVSLDSDHHRDHVLQELRLYSPLVTKGSYLVVEDTIVGHPILPGFGPGPMEAVEEFLHESAEFVVDTDRERLLMSFNLGGWLMRVTESGNGGKAMAKRKKADSKKEIGKEEPTKEEIAAREDISGEREREAYANMARWPQPQKPVPADGTLLRIDGEAVVYVMNRGQRRPFRDPDAFTGCGDQYGFGWNDIVVKPREEIDPIPVGEEVTGASDLR